MATRRVVRTAVVVMVALLPAAVVAAAFVTLSLALTALANIFDFHGLDDGGGFGAGVAPVAAAFAYQAEVVDDAQNHGLASPRDPTVLARASVNQKHVVLPDGTSALFADRARWARNGWRAELDDGYGNFVCLTIPPTTARADLQFTVGRCGS